MSTPRTVVSALRPSAAMCNRAAHACAASYRQRQRVPSLLSAPSEYMQQHSGSRSRLQQASHSWSTPQDTQHQRKLCLPQRTRRTALAFSCKLRPPPKGTALPASSCAVCCLPCRQRAPFSRSASAARHATRSAAQAAALAKCNRQRCPRLSSLRRVPFPCAVRHKRRLGSRGPSNPCCGPFADLALTLPCGPFPNLLNLHV